MLRLVYLEGSEPVWLHYKNAVSFLVHSDPVSTGHQKCNLERNGGKIPHSQRAKWKNKEVQKKAGHEYTTTTIACGVYGKVKKNEIGCKRNFSEKWKK